MAATAEKVKERVVENVTARRFTYADLSEHGGWIVSRLVKALPDLSEMGIRNWVRCLIDNNGYLFLYQPRSVGLAQLISSEGLTVQPIVREKFVFAMEGHTQEAAQLYLAMRNWGISLGASILEVKIMSDVPHDMIRDTLGGRMFTREQTFVRL